MPPGLYTPVRQNRLSISCRVAASSGRTEPGGQATRLHYAASTCICTPNSLSQEVKLGLGAQAGGRRLRHVFEKAGFSRFRRATETPFNLVLEARR
jgi:hypothetical protein